MNQSVEWNFLVVLYIAALKIVGHVSEAMCLELIKQYFIWAIYNDQPAEVTPNGGEK